jgi:hypothetical protein
MGELRRGSNVCVQLRLSETRIRDRYMSDESRVKDRYKVNGKGLMYSGVLTPDMSDQSFVDFLVLVWLA